MSRVRLWVEVDVDDERLVLEADLAARQMWGSSVAELATDWPVLVQAMFEVLLGSTPGPHPVWMLSEQGKGIEYGGEVVG